MAFNINTFKSFMPDVISSANFYVRITNPRCLDRSSYSLEKLTYLCESAQIPGVRIATDRVNRYNLSGTSYLAPYAALLEDTLPFTFYVPNDDPLPVKAFYFWMQQISGVPNTTLLSPGAGKGLIPGQVRYRDEYTTEISIFSLDRSNQSIIETKLYGAYPTTVTPIDLNWASEDILRLQTQITFSGIQVITYSRTFSSNVNNGVAEPVVLYKRDTGFGTPEVESPVYSAQINKIREELSSAQPTTTLNSIVDTARNVRDVADGFTNKISGIIEPIRQVTAARNEAEGAIIGVKSKATGVVNDYKDALNRLRLP